MARGESVHNSYGGGWGAAEAGHSQLVSPSIPGRWKGILRPAMAGPTEPATSAFRIIICRVRARALCGGLGKEPEAGGGC